MSLQEIAAGGSGAFLILLTLIEIAPIRANPWSAIGRMIGRMLNGDVIQKLEELEQRLDGHIRVDDERNADSHRLRILQFNTELLRGIRHTEEDFNEILYNIDCYERYCSDHPDYQNNRAIHAIKNIDRIYDECMKKHDFL